jgi:HK97 family phage portal protein
VIVSGGVTVKAPDIRWTGSPASWGTSSLALGQRWASYSALYRSQVWVRILVDKRALLLARLPLKVYKHDDLNRPEAPNDPYAVLLNRPNPRQSRFAFWQWVMTTFDIYGEAFVGKVRDTGGKPYQLIPMHPTAMHEAGEEEGRILWDFDNGKVSIKGIRDEDLFHPRNYNPDSYRRGLSKLESLRSTLENEDAALRAQSSFWRNGARPGVALSHPGTLSQKAADRLKLSWEAVSAGADNYGRTVVLEEGMRPEVLSLSAEEAQYIEARRLNREEVIAAYDIPPPAVHDLTRATFSNITAQLRSIYRDTMAPVCAFLESELETQLRPDFGEGMYAEFLLDGVLRGDFEDRADAYQKAINSGWQTPAEVRKLENLPFIEGSDRLFINSTMVPVGVEDEVDDDVTTIDPAIINAVGILVRSGFDPTSVLEALGLPSMEHLGLLPITLQAEEVFDAAAADAEEGLPPDDMRMLLGRLSRQKTLDEVDRSALVCGLNGSSDRVLEQFDAAVAADDGVMGLRQRIMHLAKGDVDE